jgi:hypothetical protein
MANPRTPKNPVAAEVAAPVVPEVIAQRPRTAAELRAELAALEAAEAEAAASIEAARVADLKDQHSTLSAAAAEAGERLSVFEGALSDADRAILGLKAPIKRAPKGDTEKALSAHLATLPPGETFTIAELLAQGVLDCSPSTVRNALKALDIRPNGHGKGVDYTVPSAPSVGVPSEDTSGTNKPTDEEPPAEPN